MPAPDLNSTWVNASVVIRDEPATEWRTVIVSGVVIASYPRGDKHTEKLACVTLSLKGHAQQQEVVGAFGHGRASQHRWEQAYLTKGLEGLKPYRPAGRPVSVSPSVDAAVERLHGRGLGMTRIADGLGLTVGVVRGVYQRLGLPAQGQPEQQPLELEEFTDEETVAEDQEGSAGTTEEVEAADEPDLVAAHEPWDGALVPEYETTAKVGAAGALLAIPVMRRQRVVEEIGELYRSLGRWAVYGLQTMTLFLVLSALWRIKRPEQVKGHSPGDLGKVLGLERVPEVKTIRRKLTQLAARGQAREAMLRLAQVRLEQREDLVGYLYVDGHVRPYGGKYDLGKTFSMRRHSITRATTDTWVNDSEGDPLFVVTSQVNEGLTATLKPSLRQARELVGDDRRMTVVFDRGGFSPQLFADLVDAGFDIITYSKGAARDLPEKAFKARSLDTGGKERAVYLVAEKAEVRVGNKKVTRADGTTERLIMRQVSRLKDEGGHQTHVLTTRRDLRPEEVLWRMFNRWRQENFFKYMREEFAVDGLVEYGCDVVDPSLERPNPERRALEKELDQVKAEIAKLQSKRCELIGDDKPEPPPPAGFVKFVPARLEAEELMARIRQLNVHLQELEARKAEVPERISAGDLERLRTERQQVATLFKVAAYNVETELVRMLAPHYPRTDDEGRKLIAAALRAPADLEVTDDELRVTLAPQSSPHRSRAIANLCADLNKLGAIVPGTRLRLVLDCAVPEPADVSS